MNIVTYNLPCRLITVLFTTSLTSMTFLSLIFTVMYSLFTGSYSYMPSAILLFVAFCFYFQAMIEDLNYFRFNINGSKTE